LEALICVVGRCSPNAGRWSFAKWLRLVLALVWLWSLLAPELIHADIEAGEVDVGGDGGVPAGAGVSEGVEEV